MSGDQIIAIVVGALPTLAVFGVAWRGGKWTGRMEQKLDAATSKADKAATKASEVAEAIDRHTHQLDALQDSLDALPCHDCPIVPAGRKAR